MMFGFLTVVFVLVALLVGVPCLINKVENRRRQEDRQWVDHIQHQERTKSWRL